MRRKIFAIADRVLDAIGVFVIWALIVCGVLAAIGWVIEHWEGVSTFVLAVILTTINPFGVIALIFLGLYFGLRSLFLRYFSKGGVTIKRIFRARIFSAILYGIKVLAAAVMVVAMVAVAGWFVVWKVRTIIDDPHPIEALFGMERVVDVPSYGTMNVKECKARGICFDHPPSRWHDRLMVEINRIANTPYPLAEREEQIAELEREIDRLQRTEEAIVVATGAPRQPGSPAWVVLGVKALEA
jgi:hypothetical protein